MPVSGKAAAATCSITTAGTEAGSGTNVEVLAPTIATTAAAKNDE
jgi:hypothetical protein